MLASKGYGHFGCVSSSGCKCD